MKTMKFLAVASLALAAAACSNDEVPMVSNEAKALTIHFDAPALSRAIEAPIATGTQSKFTTVTLQFWGATGKAQSKGTLDLTAAQIAEAATTEGTKVTMPAGTVEVSMIANVGLKDKTILDIQGLGSTADAFAGAVPMTSPAKAPSPHASAAGAMQVNLEPTPDLARIEVFGKIEPVKAIVNGKETTAYKSVTVEAVYINNYYESAKKDALIFYPAGNAKWGNYDAVLTDAVTDANRADFESKAKAAAYQFFPSTGAANVPHIIVKLKYELNGATAAVENRYITIKNYKENGDDVTDFVGGKIYKLDLAGLSSYFTTNPDDGSQGKDPTDNTPEAEDTDLYVTIQTYAWSDVNLTPVLP